MTTTDIPDLTQLRIERDEQFREARKQGRRADAAEAECDRQAHRISRLEREADRLWGMLDTTRRRCEVAEAKVYRVELVRLWRHDDGREFVFADDLRAALGVTGR